MLVREPPLLQMTDLQDPTVEAGRLWPQVKANIHRVSLMQYPCPFPRTGSARAGRSEAGGGGEMIILI